MLDVQCWVSERLKLGTLCRKRHYNNRMSLDQRLSIIRAAIEDRAFANMRSISALPLLIISTLLSSAAQRYRPLLYSPAILSLTEPKHPVITLSDPGHIKRDRSGYIRKPYGEDVTLCCSGKNATNLAMTDGDNLLQAIMINSTTIKVTLQPDIAKHKFYCKAFHPYSIDILLIRVEPVFTARATNITHALDANKTRTFFIHRGFDFEVYCTAADADSLSIIREHTFLQATAINKTTVASRVTDDSEGLYSCLYSKGTNNVNSQGNKIIVDNLPEVQDFRCILYKHSKLKCSWTSSSMRNTFELVILRSGGVSHLCSKIPEDLTTGCEGVIDKQSDKFYNSTFSVQVKTCVDGLFCNHQTFEFDASTITKLDAESL